jgi:5-methylthioadenosine/S-adenosylhomocysteine deaminase
MEMGHGIPPIQEALDHGIRPSLSVDVETQMPSEFFTQMRTVFTLQRMQALARQRAGETNPPRLLTVREVVEFATMAGARANRLEALNNAYGAVVLGMDTSNVDTVIIGGVVRKRGGRLVDVDLDAVRRDAEASRAFILKQAGWAETRTGK